MSRPITVYEANAAGLQSMAVDIDATLLAAQQAAEEAPIVIPEFTELIGIEPEVYRQINAALNSGKQHLMFYGPPGTGKTTLAQKVAEALSPEWRLVTGSSDWTSQDIIGGYQPVGGGEIRFFPGVLLEHFDKPLVIDELNRCDIDKVLGPLFTVLSGQSTVLPYLTDTTDPASARYSILPRPEEDPQPHEYSPGERWRLLATINSLDKASLYQMSYALTRRFGWILVDVPKNLALFIARFLHEVEEAIDAVPDPLPAVPLAQVWQVVNSAREVGPAPIIDSIRFVREAVDGFDHFGTINGPADARVNPLLDSFYTFLLPMMDGIHRPRGDALADGICDALQLGADERAADLRRRIQAMTV